MATGREAMEIDAGGRARGMQIALVAAALGVVFAALWFFVLKGDGSEGPPAAPARSAASAPATDSKDERAEKAGGVVDRQKKTEGTKVAATNPAPVESFEVFAPKDPFDPLVAASSGGSSSDDAGSNAGNDGASTGGHKVRLVDLFGGADEERARIEVDDAVYQVAEGDVFAESFQLVSIDTGCATLLFGDDQFSLCEGEEIVK